jgi:nucleotide-binding universal stress UspA family protein
MSYKTVLVHCNDPRRVERILAPAVEVAAMFAARLIGLSVTPPPVVVAAGIPGAPDTAVLDAHCHAYRRGNPQMREAFAAAGARCGLAAEWREAQATSMSVARCVLAEARAADLVVAAQGDARWSDSAQLDVAERLAEGSGRPVLIIPNAGCLRNLAARILLAWDGRREAARAAFDALPLLKRAQAVEILRIAPPSAGDVAGDAESAEVRSALARHGVRCAATRLAPPHAEVGPALVLRAAEWGADLLVMGCYGHSRLREFVLGGASRHVLAHMQIPVLMSH